MSNSQQNFCILFAEGKNIREQHSHISNYNAIRGLFINKPRNNFNKNIVRPKL